MNRQTKTAQVQSETTIFSHFPHPTCNIQTCERVVPLPCPADFSHTVATTLLLSSDAPTNETLPTTTANRVREREI